MKTGFQGSIDDALKVIETRMQPTVYDREAFKVITDFVDAVVNNDDLLDEVNAKLQEAVDAERAADDAVAARQERESTKGRGFGINGLFGREED